MKVIYPGSFDPVTAGHIDIIERAASVFSEVVVAVAVNLEKSETFSLEQRAEFLRDGCGHLANVRVDWFKGLLVDYVEKQGARVVIKGLRAISDFEFELQMALMNKRLNESVETLFMMTSAEHSFLSSGLVKELAVFGAPLKGLVSPLVEQRLIEKMKEPNGEVAG
jgi:pantetheine-phosphate adenylyltransferase